MGPFVGYFCGHEQFDPVTLLKRARRAEAVGLSGIMASDHFHPWIDSAGQAGFAWTWLGAVAATTERIALGTGVSTALFRYHPAVIAQAWATLALLAPGRTYLGLGIGEASNERALGGGPSAYSEQVRRLREAVHIIRELWRGDFVDFQGEFFTLRQAKLYSLPSEPPPIYIAASGPKSAQMAGEIGDGIISTQGKPDAQYRDVLLPAFAAGAREAGKDPERLTRIILLKVVLAGPADGLPYARLWMGTRFKDEADPRVIEAKAAALDDSEVLAKWFFSPDPHDHVKWIQHYLRLGFTQAYAHSPGPDEDRFIDTYGQVVVPALRSASS
jgi:coenzyme F420-dependent glucose-6-phosphate dehydrogenase